MRKRIQEQVLALARDQRGDRQQAERGGSTELEWAGLAREEARAGGSNGLTFGLAVLVTVLVTALVTVLVMMWRWISPVMASIASIIWAASESGWATTAGAWSTSTSLPSGASAPNNDR